MLAERLDKVAALLKEADARRRALFGGSSSFWAAPGRSSRAAAKDRYLANGGSGSAGDGGSRDPAARPEPA